MLPPNLPDEYSMQRRWGLGEHDNGSPNRGSGFNLRVVVTSVGMAKKSTAPRETAPKSLENWLWDAACQVRGPLDAPKFKDYILPLIFLKRLSDVFEDEVQRVAAEVGGVQTALKLIEQDHGLVRFYVPPESRWQSVADKTIGLGEKLTDAVRAVSRQNPRLAGVIDTVDFNASAAGQPIVGNDQLAGLVRVLGQRRLGMRDVAPDLIGNAYEYLLRKFAEGQGQSAGEFYTPPEVARLMARILDPQPGMTVDDPTVGSAGLLIKCHLRLLETHGVQSSEFRVQSSAVEGSTFNVQRSTDVNDEPSVMTPQLALSLGTDETAPTAAGAMNVAPTMSGSDATSEVLPAGGHRAGHEPANPEQRTAKSEQPTANGAVPTLPPDIAPLRVFGQEINASTLPWPA
jgi:HsdM N-terminal domain/N-6 DNA Methylase